jgi:hypothetical protein
MERLGYIYKKELKKWNRLKKEALINKKILNGMTWLMNKYFFWSNRRH